MNTTKATLGLWTPWALVLCCECHGPQFQSKRYEMDTPEWKELIAPKPLKEGQGITFCDKCGQDIRIDHRIALEHNLLRKCEELGMAACMAQTGGMNHALCVDLPEGKFYVTFAFEHEEKWVLARCDQEDNGLDTYQAVTEEEVLAIIQQQFEA